MQPPLFQRSSRFGYRRWRRSGWLLVRLAPDTPHKARDGCDPACRRSSTSRDSRKVCCAAADLSGSHATGILSRLKHFEQAPNDGPHAMVRLLARVIGVGIETADMLVHEVLSRNMHDRRAIARYAGLTGSPDESGRKRLHHRARSRQDESWRDRTKNPTMEKMRHPA